MQNKLVTVVGGSGFVGSYIVNELLKSGYLVQVISRDPEESAFLKTAAKVGQLNFVKCDIRNYDSLKNILKKSYAVINAVGIMYESGFQKFKTIHIEGAKAIAKACAENKISNFIHISSLGVDKNSCSKYAKTKFEAELEIVKIMPNAVIVRPSLVFGHEDKFFNRFASMTRFSLFLPLIGGGKTKFQPIYVGDLAKAIVKILQEKKNKFKIYELGGSKVYTFKELLEFILINLGKERILLYLPFFISKIAAFSISMLTKKILTPDQVSLLKYDNIIEPDKKVGNLKDLAIIPQMIETIVPKYIERYK